MAGHRWPGRRGCVGRLRGGDGGGAQFVSLSKHISPRCRPQTTNQITVAVVGCYKRRRNWSTSCILTFDGVSLGSWNAPVCAAHRLGHRSVRRCNFDTSGGCLFRHFSSLDQLCFERMNGNTAETEMVLHSYSEGGEPLQLRTRFRSTSRFLKCTAAVSMCWLDAHSYGRSWDF